MTCPKAIVSHDSKNAIKMERNGVKVLKQGTSKLHSKGLCRQTHIFQGISKVSTSDIEKALG